MTKPEHKLTIISGEHSIEVEYDNRRDLEVGILALARILQDDDLETAIRRLAKAMLSGS